MWNGSNEKDCGEWNGTASSKVGIVIKVLTNTIKDKIEFYTVGLGGKRKGGDDVEGVHETIVEDGKNN